MKSRVGERLLLATLFLALPALFVFLVLLPSRKRMEALKDRQGAITERLKALPAIQPLSAKERLILEDPRAPYRTRIPFLDGDSERLAHYHGVVSELQNAWKKDGVVLLSLRANWDGLKGSYTLPGELGNPALGLPVAGTASAGRLQGWVLDARVGGPPDQLFQAMESLARVNPLLEPVGLRWESVPDRTRPSLLLRNLILVP